MIRPAMGPFTFDAEKAVEALLYVTERTNGDMYTALKLLYLADKCHLHRYGRLIYGDEYYALPHGPVPQRAYDLIKFVRGDKDVLPYPPAQQAFSVHGNTVRPMRGADTSLLSESDEECLQEVIRDFGHERFAALKNATHDAAYKATSPNRRISIEAIAAMSADPAPLVQYLTESDPDRA